MSQHVTVEKAWGAELIVVNRRLTRGAGYCGKRMTLRAGFRCSLHWHHHKDEVFFVERGRMLVELSQAGIGHLVAHGVIPEYETRVVGPGESVLVPPGTIHRFTGLEDVVFFEFSSPDDPADSFRLEPSGAAPQVVRSEGSP